MELTAFNLAASEIQNLAKQRRKLIGAYTHKKSGLQVLITEDAGILHISAGYPNHCPSLALMREIKNKYYPNKEFALYFPPVGVKVHENAHHIFEVLQAKPQETEEGKN